MTFTVDGLDSHLVAAALSAEHGIGVRAGKFCAHLLVDALLEEDADDEPHGTAVRVSAGLATHEEHVERLLAAVAVLAAEGPGTDYVEVPGQGWLPVDDTRELDAPAALVTRRPGAGGAPMPLPVARHPGFSRTLAGPTRPVRV